MHALSELGRLEIEIGKRADGCRHLRLFLDHWGDADWELQDVSTARALADRCP
jgi:hypothetical protein